MHNDKYRLLVINPGSTSTKVSLFENETSVFEKSLFHDSSVLLIPVGDIFYKQNPHKNAKAVDFIPSSSTIFVATRKNPQCA